MYVHTSVMTGGNYMYRYIANRTGSYIVLGINQATYSKGQIKVYVPFSFYGTKCPIPFLRILPLLRKNDC